MTADGLAPADVYRGFLDAVNRQDLAAAEQFVDVVRYRENCVGFTHGFVPWEEAKASVRTVWKGLPDLHVDLHEVLGDGDVGGLLENRLVAQDMVHDPATACGGLETDVIRRRHRN